MSLKLELTDFQCYSRLKLSFEKGVHLLKGESGCGKTTILKAIEFCLYGKGMKIVKRGCKKCSVKLEFNGVSIIRTKGPNSLTVITEKGKYIDDVAQEYIDSIFGKDFCITSYIRQSDVESFMTLSASEKLTFLERICFSKEDIEIMNRLKTICKSNKSSYKKTIENIQSQIPLLEKMYKEPKKIEYPLGGLYKKENLDRYISELEEKKKRLESLTKKLSEYNKSRSIIEKNKTFNNLMDQLTQKIEKNKIDYPEKAEYLDIDKYKKISNLETSLLKRELLTTQLSENKNKFLELNYDKTTYNTYLELYKESLIPHLERQISDQECSLNAEIKIKELEESLKEYDEPDDLETEINSLQKRLSILENELTERKKRRACPKCNSFLKIDGDTLIYHDSKNNLSEDELKSNIKTIKTDISDYRSTLEFIKDTKKEINSLKKILKDKVDIDSLKNELALQKKYKEILKKEEKNISVNDMLKLDLKKLITNLEKELSYTDGITLKDLENAKRVLLDYSEYKKGKELLKTLEKEYKKYESEIIDIKEDLELDVTETENDINNLKKDIEEGNKKMIEIEKWMTYKKEEKKWKKGMEEIRGLKEKEREILKKEKLGDVVLKKVLETESDIIGMSINILNTQIQNYMDNFFEEKIMVRIESFKENANGDVKPGINIGVHYEDDKCELKELSGGEKGRCILAVCLAFNMLVGSKILMLDEFLSTVGHETLIKIIDVLKEEPNRTCLIVLHNATEGIFDSVIPCNKKI